MYLRRVIKFLSDGVLEFCLSLLNVEGCRLGVEAISRCRDVTFLLLLAFVDTGCDPYAVIELLDHLE